MKCFVLASGSEGNSTYINTGRHNILIDCGRNTKYITDKLASINVDIKDIDTILLSHTHHDHMDALKVLIKKCNPVVYVGKNMMKELDFLTNYDKVSFYDEDIILTDCKINLINTSHDAPDSKGFIVDNNQERIVQITDTGYLNMKYLNILKDCDYYIFESNHDIEMIINGPYPDYLKARIVGPKGHLSNKEAAIYLAKIVGNNTKKVVLAHLSKHNNTEEVALNTVKEIFREYGNLFDNFVCAKPDEIVEVVND